MGTLGRRRGGYPSAEAEIVASGVVEREWYLDQNPDVSHAGLDPVMHFARYGFLEGRQPNPFFSGRWYDDIETLRQTADSGTLSAPTSLFDEVEQSGIVDREWYLRRR